MAGRLAKYTSEARMLNDPKDALLNVVLFDAAILGVMLGCFWAGIFVVRRLGYPVGYGLGALGFVRPRIGYFAGAVLGLVIGIGAAFALNFLLVPLTAFVLEELGYSLRPGMQEPLMRGLGDWIGESPGIAISVIIFVVVLFGPAIEEIIFRGALFGSLYKLGLVLSSKLWKRGNKASKAVENASFVFSALASSAMFAPLHLEPLLLPALFVLAIILCALYRWTGSLLTSFMAHAAFNWFAVSILIFNELGVLPTQV